MTTKFNLGCGHKLLEGYTNLDSGNLDLNSEKELIKFSENEYENVEEILLDNVFEHLTIHPTKLFPYLIDCLQTQPTRGKLIIIYPNFFNWKSRLKFLFGNFIWADGWHPFHTKMFKGSQLALMLRWMGCNIERVPNDLFDQEIKIVAYKKA